MTIQARYRLMIQFVGCDLLAMNFPKTGNGIKDVSGCKITYGMDMMFSVENGITVFHIVKRSHHSRYMPIDPAHRITVLATR